MLAGAEAIWLCEIAALVMTHGILFENPRYLSLREALASWQSTVIERSLIATLAPLARNDIKNIAHRFHFPSHKS
ncbi:MAG: hypothetical protein K2N54_02070 [Helicobacter sp.]|nr:hypothetical protein [Helicobacter sp.]